MRLNYDVDDLDGCCAIDVINFLRMGKGEGHKNGEALIAEASKRNNRYDGEECTSLIATTTQNQVSVADELKRLGFKQVKKFKSRTTGNTITTWMYVTSKRSTKAKK
jgi:hypothetical protein